VHISSFDRKYAIRYYCAFILSICALLLTCTFSLVQPVHAAVATNIAGTPTITWDSSMIYTGQNANLPWGPVGEKATVHGSSFAASAKLLLVLVAGDSNKTATLCSQAGVSVATVTASSAGTFSASFLWPATAGKVKQGYSICAQNTSHVAVSTHDSGLFTVLASSPPTIRISTTSVSAGNSVTVTGQDWVPAQSVTVVIGNCGDCVGSPSNTFVTRKAVSVGSNTGTFSATLLIPTSFRPSAYTVDAYAHMNTSTKIALLDTINTMKTNLPRLTITAAVPSITPIVSATATPTALPTATATRATSIGGANTSLTPPNTGSQGSNSFPWTLILGLLLPLAVTLAGLSIYMLKQRQKRSSAPNHVLASQANYFEQYGAQMAYGFPLQAMQQSNQFDDGFNQFVPEPTWPQNYPNDMQQPTGPQNYPHNMHTQITGPQNAYSAITVQNLPHNEMTVQDTRNYGLACFQCGTPFLAGAQFCGHCGTQNDEFFT
jgi:hypothetical protein